MNVDPIARMREGAELLIPLLTKNGFQFELVSTGKGSGGNFAVGEFRRDDRRLELHYRWGLGIVTYYVGSSSLGHLQYMKRMGVYDLCQFASTVLDGGLDGFERLRSDLESYGHDFLCGDAVTFRALAALPQKPPGLV